MLEWEAKAQQALDKIVQRLEEDVAAAGEKRELPFSELQSQLSSKEALERDRSLHEARAEEGRVRADTLEREASQQRDCQGGRRPLPHV